jgi:hypothetical protein
MDLLASQKSGPRDVSRCGALSLLKKTLHYRGDSAETAAGINVNLWVLVMVVTGGELPPTVFCQILILNLFEPSRKILYLARRN